MAVAFVQTAAIQSTGSGANLQTGAFASNPTVGNYLCVWAFGWSGTNNSTQPTFSDTGLNTYTVPTNAFQRIANDAWVILGYAKVNTGGATFKVKVTLPAAWSQTSNINIVASEFSGVLATSPEDGSVGTAPGTTAQSFAPGNLTVASGDLVIAAMANDDGTNPAHVDGVTSGQPGTPPSGYTAVGTNYVPANEVGQAIYTINHSTPTNPTWTTTDTATQWAAAQFALKATAVAAGGFNAAWVRRSEVLGTSIYCKAIRHLLGDREFAFIKGRGKSARLGVGWGI